MNGYVAADLAAVHKEKAAERKALSILAGSVETSIFSGWSAEDIDEALEDDDAFDEFLLTHPQEDIDRFDVLVGRIMRGDC